MGDSSIESWSDRRLRLLKQYPDYCTVVDVARALGITKAGVVKHTPHIKHIIVEGMTLYHRQAVAYYAGVNIKDNGKSTSRMTFTGRDVERVRRIMAEYYRTQIDFAPSELLKLAKRIAGI